MRKYCGDNTTILAESKKIINNYLPQDEIRSLASTSIIDEIVEEAPNPQIVKTEISNLGKEGKYREFKTSALFFAGSNGLDIEKQTFVIMKTICGFLNAEGGSLFIGVYDSGDIAGLQNDYDNLQGKGNSDKYELYIRKNIVKYFNKDVNFLIELKFNTFDGKEYVELVIPEYNQPIPLGDDFYQRQGNQTRILKGTDLILFMQRRLILYLQQQLIIQTLQKKISSSTKKKKTQLFKLMKMERVMNCMGIIPFTSTVITN